MNNESKKASAAERFGEFLYTLGMIAAAAVSYSVNKSVLWAIFHFILGWWYLAYKLACKYAYIFM